ncbi:50S ribosomal protein L10 [Patescibacteria group bacterium]|nr:50S ribosomal protein L10 [Patescibacteria group bacterium]MBU0879401.1 50S ribosomal protein L10 [Patescibacteria group bacterium]MBU0880313.1 50S ribosomal protein L10 [Patescibacteria group bacterium]MBU0898172.1 50S ribosomal protein L10 [Patescibacteria group bacterium]MBU1062979.1 50S ribosomal protein L10 [Patescibacteria group bacterium]
MPKSKDQKKQMLKNLTEKIAKAKSIVFTKFNGLEVKDNEDLRIKLRAENSEYYVAKKTLLNIAFKDSLIKDLNIKDLPGQIAAIFGYEDEVAPAKVVDKFRKDKEDKIEFIGGILENKFINAVQVNELAKLPSKTELYAKIVGSINAPISGLVNVFAGNLKNLVYVLKAIGDKKN